MSLYMLLIYDDEKAWESAPPQDGAEVMQAYYDFYGGGRLGRRGPAQRRPPAGGDGHDRPGPGRGAPADRRAVRRDQGAARRVLPGRLRDLDEAIEWASRIPGATSGSVEVRPVMEIPPRDQFEADLAAASGRE